MVLRIIAFRRRADRLRDPRTRRVAGGQNHAVLETLDSVQAFADFLWAHYSKKCRRPAAGWGDLIDVSSALRGVTL